MKKIKYIEVLFVCFCFISKAQSNFIVAGKYNAMDFYHKFVPDSFVINVSAYSNTGIGTYSLDINNDGVKDFAFKLQAPNGGLGAGYGDCSISALNNNKIASGRFDSCFTASGTYNGRTLMAYAFNSNDTINNAASWASEVDLRFDEFVLGYSSCGGNYDGPGMAYIGVRVMVDTVYRYGWIKIGTIEIDPSVIAGGYITMKAFACENNVLNADTSATQVISLYTEQLTLLPNPPNDIVYVQSAGLLTADPMLYDANGREIDIAEKKINIHSYQMNVGELAQGVYFVKCNTNLGYLVKKLIIQR